MANLPNYNHKFNYNARAFDTETRTFENIGGGSWSGLTLPATGWSKTDDDYITLTGAYVPYTDSSLNSPSAMTFIAYILPTVGGSSNNIMAQRNSNYNWMLRVGTSTIFWHTRSSGVATQSGGNYPQAVVFRTSGGTYETWKYGDNTKNSATSSWGSGSDDGAVFAGYYSGDETWQGNLYWMYLATDYLSDAEVKDVIDFNEQYGKYDTKTSEFTADRGTDTYSLTTEASWNAVSDSLWISVSPSSGTGDSTLTITVGRNTGSTGRTGTVTVKDTSDNTLLVWTVEQGYRATPIMNIIYNNSNW